MKLAVIVPPAYIRMPYARQTSYHMALGQWLVKYPMYFNHFRERHRDGDFIMVDNGAAEPEDERVDWDKILDAANIINADEIVLLDVLKDAKATIELTVETAVDVHPHRRCIVPQGTTWDEWVDCLEELDIRLNGGYATIGIPKHLEQLEGGRAKAIELLGTYRETHNIHLFGIYHYPYYEVTSAKKEWPWIRGIDSGAPIAYSQYSRWIGEEVHYSLQENTEPDRRFTELNVDTLVGWCNE